MALDKEFQMRLVYYLTKAAGELNLVNVAVDFSMLRDLVHAGLSFKELAQQTGLGEKAIHRMLSPRGNPTTRNLFAVTKAICEHLSFKPRVAFGAN